MKKRSVLRDKSLAFALRIVKLSQFLHDKNEYVLSKQVLRSGTAIGASIHEAEYAQSDADFISKFSIALKEANETVYWLELLHATDYIETNLYENLIVDCNELTSMLVATIKTLKNKENTKIVK
ncbi:MAG: four helix bundle protein [Prevotellaceae bacterium]|jgi:four helix bundle protein|nr:four helix bundle protein [Prevotellaceae bacterium]